MKAYMALPYAYDGQIPIGFDGPPPLVVAGEVREGQKEKGDSLRFTFTCTRWGGSEKVGRMGFWLINLFRSERAAAEAAWEDLEKQRQRVEEQHNKLTKSLSQLADLIEDLKLAERCPGCGDPDCGGVACNDGSEC